jgi:homoaconitase/3-isopropylmalate dehydratase large subunit
MFRKMQCHVWSSATIRKIKQEDPDLALIADCRFPNEVKAVKNAGGIVIKLNRNVYDSDHSSETALDKENYDYTNFDLVVDNQDMDIHEKNYYISAYLRKIGVL